MTLVAAYTTAGVPVMVGDFMISTPRARGLGSKKVFRGRPNVALGWTGRLLHAQQVLIPLLTELPERPSRADLEAALARLTSDSPSRGPLKLVGWIADGDDLSAFHWDAALPDIQWGEEWFVGTGGPAFEIYSRLYDQTTDGAGRHDERAALVGLLATLAQMNGGDVFIPAPTHAIGVGAGYEALYWSASTNAFQYVDDVIYFAVRSHLNRQGRVRAINLLPILGYQARREISLWTVVDGADTRRCNVLATTPPATLERPETVRAEMDRVSETATGLPARFYAGVALFAHPTEVAPAMPIVTCPWDEQPIVQGSLGDLAVQTGPRELEEHFRQRAAAHRTSPLPYESFTSPVRSDAWLRPASDLG